MFFLFQFRHQLKTLKILIHCSHLIHLQKEEETEEDWAESDHSRHGGEYGRRSLCRHLHERRNKKKRHHLSRKHKRQLNELKSYMHGTNLTCDQAARLTNAPSVHQAEMALRHIMLSYLRPHMNDGIKGGAFGSLMSRIREHKMQDKASRKEDEQEWYNRDICPYLHQAKLTERQKLRRKQKVEEVKRI